MKPRELLEFTPSKMMPLESAFHAFLAEKGVKSEYSWDYFDSYALDDTGKPIVAVKTIRNTVTSALTRKLTQSQVPVKVILVQGPYPAFSTFRNQSVFLKSTGAGVFVDNVGWVIEPTGRDKELQDEFRYQMADRWKKVEGVWRKTCTNCKESKTPDDFYKNPNKTGQDPKRNHCKECVLAKQRARDARK